MTEPAPESTMVSARARARRSGLGRGLLVIAAVLALTGVVSAFIAPWPELLAARQAIATRMTDDSTPHRFVAPGSANFDLPAGRIFVAYLTDAEFRVSPACLHACLSCLVWPAPSELEGSRGAS